MSGEIAIFDLQNQEYDGLIHFFQGKVIGVVCTGDGSIITGSERGDLLTLNGSGYGLRVASETGLDCPLAWLEYQQRNSKLLLVGRNGSLLSFKCNIVQLS